MDKKIITIIYSDINLNITDGSTIWLSNIINTLNLDNKLVYFLNLHEIKNNNFIRNIINVDLFKIIGCESIVDVKNKLELFYDENKNNIEDIIIRSKLIFDIIDVNEKILELITFYGSDDNLKNIVDSNNKFKELWVSNDKLKELFISNGVQENKIKLTQSSAWKYKFDLPERTDDEIRLIYVGTLRDEENILEIIDEFKKIHETRPEVLLKIIYGKIHGDDEFVDKINQIINEGFEGITFKHNLSHKDTCYEIATSDIGICWRKNGWKDNGEISIKEKEYEIFDLYLINNINILINKKYNLINKNIVINQTYYIKKNKYTNLINNIIDEKNILNNNYVINVKFSNNFETLFENEKITDKIKFDFTYKITESNKYINIYLYKNVFYKILANNLEIRVMLFDNNNEDIFRNCLSNVNINNDIYFQINENNFYKLYIKTKYKHEFKIENYISINYLCDDDVYMLNLESQIEKFKMNKIILNKFGIKINRFNAINGYDDKWNDLWIKFLNTKETILEKKLGRRLLTRGSIGYLLSMKEILSNVKSKYVCIFDDDIIIKNDFSLEKISSILIKLSNFNIIKFGSSQWTFDNIKLNNEREYYYPSELSNGSFANIYNSSIIDKILEKINLFNTPFDFEPIRQFYKNKTYIIYPNLIIANLDDVSTITNKRRSNEYDKFKWNKTNYIILPFIDKKITIKNNVNILNKKHFLIGIISFKRLHYFKKCLESMIKTIDKNHFFTIYISYGLDINEKINDNLIKYLDNLFIDTNNVNIILHLSYMHYMFYLSNNILKFSTSINYDFGFILNDDIFFNKNWFLEYYNISIKYNIQHLCWQLNNSNTVYENELKTNGLVLNSNGVLLTFTSNIVNVVGLFNEIDFNVRGQAHIEWSLRCCNAGFNSKKTFFDIKNSNELIYLNIEKYTSSIANTPYFDKVIYFVDKYELKKRNKLLKILFEKN